MASEDLIANTTLCGSLAKEGIAFEQNSGGDASPVLEFVLRCATDILRFIESWRNENNIQQQDVDDAPEYSKFEELDSNLTEIASTLNQRKELDQESVRLQQQRNNALLHLVTKRQLDLFLVEKLKEAQKILEDLNASTSLSGDNLDERTEEYYAKLLNEMSFSFENTMRAGEELNNFMQAETNKNIETMAQQLADIEFKELQIGKSIGAGGFGQVKTGSYRGHPVAVKFCNKNKNDLLTMDILIEFKTELQRWKKMKHENIVELYGSSFSADGRLCFVMEVLHESLADFLYPKQPQQPLSNEILVENELNLNLICQIGVGITSALAYLHGQGIVHRDIKPQNVLLNHPLQVKLCDFGLATVRKDFSTGTTQKLCGTPQYMAPEQVGAKPQISPKSDIFAVGIILNELISRVKPWKGVGQLVILHNVSLGERPEIDREALQKLVDEENSSRSGVGQTVPVDASTGAWLSRLIECCWAQDRFYRPSAAAVEQALVSRTWGQEVPAPTRRKITRRQDLNAIYEGISEEETWNLTEKSYLQETTKLGKIVPIMIVLLLLGLIAGIAAVFVISTKDGNDDSTNICTYGDSSFHGTSYCFLDSSNWICDGQCCTRKVENEGITFQVPLLECIKGENITTINSEFPKCERYLASEIKLGNITESQALLKFGVGGMGVCPPPVGTAQLESAQNDQAKLTTTADLFTVDSKGSKTLLFLQKQTSETYANAVKIISPLTGTTLFANEADAQWEKEDNIIGAFDASDSLFLPVGLKENFALVSPELTSDRKTQALCRNGGGRLSLQPRDDSEELVANCSFKLNQVASELSISKLFHPEATGRPTRAPTSQPTLAKNGCIKIPTLSDHPQELSHWNETHGYGPDEDICWELQRVDRSQAIAFEVVRVDTECDIDILEVNKVGGEQICEKHGAETDEETCGGAVQGLATYFVEDSDLLMQWTSDENNPRKPSNDPTVRPERFKYKGFEARFSAAFVIRANENGTPVKFSDMYPEESDYKPGARRFILLSPPKGRALDRGELIVDFTSILTFTNHGNITLYRYSSTSAEQNLKERKLAGPFTGQMPSPDKELPPTLTVREEGVLVVFDASENPLCDKGFEGTFRWVDPSPPTPLPTPPGFDNALESLRADSSTDDGSSAADHSTGLPELATTMYVYCVVAVLVSCGVFVALELYYKAAYTTLIAPVFAILDFASDGMFAADMFFRNLALFGILSMVFVILTMALNFVVSWHLVDRMTTENHRFAKWLYDSAHSTGGYRFFSLLSIGTWNVARSRIFGAPTIFCAPITHTESVYISAFSLLNNISEDIPQLILVAIAQTRMDWSVVSLTSMFLSIMSLLFSVVSRSGSLQVLLVKEAASRRTQTSQTAAQVPQTSSSSSSSAAAAAAASRQYASTTMSTMSSRADTDTSVHVSIQQS